MVAGSHLGARTVSLYESTLRDRITRSLAEAENARALLASVSATKRQFSLTRALASMLQTEKLRADGLEGEISDETARRFGKDIRPGSLYIPIDGARDLQAGSGSGAFLRPSVQNPGGFIAEALRDRSLLTKLGATVLDMPPGTAQIARISTGATTQWLATEATATSTNQPVLGQVSLTPKSVAAVVTFSRRLSLQSTPPVDMMLERELGAALARAVDTAAIQGSGSAGQPLGVVSSAFDISAGTSSTITTISEIVESLLDAGCDDERLRFAMAPDAKQTLSIKEVSSGGTMLMANASPPTILGIPVHASSVVPADAFILGDWSQFLVARWGVLEVAIDPFTSFSTGLISMRCIIDCDVAPLQSKAFSVRTSVS